MTSLGIRFTVINVFFLCASAFTLVLCLILPSYYIKTDKEKKRDELQKGPSIFKSVDFYRKKDGRSALHMQSILLTIRPERKKTYFLFPHGEAYTKSGLPIFYSAKNGVYDEVTDEIQLSENVSIESTDSKLKADFAKYIFKEEMFIGEGEVNTEKVAQNRDQIIVNSNKVKSWPVEQRSIYEGNVAGEIIRRRKYEDGVSFKSQYLLANLKESLIRMNGDVYLKNQGITAEGLRGEIFLDNYNKKLKYYVLYDDVVINQIVTLKDGRKVKRKAFAEVLEGFVQRDQVKLSGDPRVIQGEEVIKGNLITLTDNREVIEVDEAASSFVIEKQQN